MIPNCHRYPDHASWLADRIDPAGHHIGGSDVPKILGKSRFGGPWSVWHAYQPDHEPEGPRAFSDPATGGSLLEPALVETYRGRIRHEVDTGLLVFRHPALDWARASLDGWVADSDDGPGVVECKSISYHTWGEVGADGDEIRPYTDIDIYACGISLEHLYQIAWYFAAIPSAQWCDYVAGKRSFRPEDYAVSADGTLLRGAWTLSDIRVLRVWRWAGVDGLLERIALWRERHLIEGVEPDAEASRACIAAQIAKKRGNGRDVTPDELVLARDLEAARAAAKIGKTTGDTARALLLQSMDDANELWQRGRRVVWLAGRQLKTKLD